MTIAGQLIGEVPSSALGWLIVGGHWRLAEPPGETVSGRLQLPCAGNFAGAESSALAAGPDRINYPSCSLHGMFAGRRSFRTGGAVAISSRSPGGKRKQR